MLIVFELGFGDTVLGHKSKQNLYSTLPRTLFALLEQHAQGSTIMMAVVTNEMTANFRCSRQI